MHDYLIPLNFICFPLTPEIQAYVGISVDLKFNFKTPSLKEPQENRISF